MSTREGSLDAPTRHAIDWKSADFYDEDKALKEAERIFDICHGCRRCVNLCTAFPSLFDLILLRLAGKVVVFHFRGTEARLFSEFAKANPFHFSDTDPYNFARKYPEQAQRLLIDFVCEAASAVFVNDPELQTYVPRAEIVPRAIDLDEWQPAPAGANARVLVVHAPSRDQIKGTDHILRAGINYRFGGPVVAKY